MQPGEYWIGVTISVIVSLLMLLASICKPKLGRWLFSILFFWAAYTNWYTAHVRPEVYLEYGELAMLSFYEDFINGFFAQHIEEVVSVIAVLQLLIAFCILLKGFAFRSSCIGGVLFLLAIAPLGIGAGFPSSLFMATGLVILYKKNDNTYAWQRARLKNQKIANETKTQT